MGKKEKPKPGGSKKDPLAKKIKFKAYWLK